MADLSVRTSMRVETLMREQTRRSGIDPGRQVVARRNEHAGSFEATGAGVRAGSVTSFWRSRLRARESSTCLHLGKLRRSTDSCQAGQTAFRGETQWWGLMRTRRERLVVRPSGVRRPADCINA